MKIVVAITGASGVAISKKLLKFLNSRGIETYLIISEAAKKVCRYEGIRVEELIGLSTKSFKADEIESEISSSSFQFDTLIVVPCSMKTLAAIAHGYSNNLITRVADNALRLGKKLILVPRETPLSYQAIENMRLLKLLGAIIIMPVIAYYTKPKTIEDVTNFIVGKILDSLGMEHDLYNRWTPALEEE